MRFIPLASIFLLVAATAQAGSNVKALGKQFRRLDANRDGLLTSGELAKLLPGKLTKNNALIETQEAMFAWFDEDASEGIDLSEWLEAQRNTDFGRPYFSAAVIDELDTNGNGKLTWKEFSRVIPKYVSAKKARGWFNAVSSGLSVNLGISGSSSSDSFSGGTLTLGGSTFYFGSIYQGSTTVTGGTLTSDSSLQIIDFSGLSSNAGYTLLDYVPGTFASSIDQGGTTASE
jgi:Ca2+-binding EF-hand superfamily protein